MIVFYSHLYSILTNLPYLKSEIGSTITGARAGAIALIATALQDGLTYEAIAQKAQELGLSLDQPHLKQFLLDRYTGVVAEK